MLPDYTKTWQSMEEISCRLHEVERHQQDFATCTWWECARTRENIKTVKRLVNLIDDIWDVVNELDDTEE